MLEFNDGVEVFREAQGKSVDILVSGDWCPRFVGEELLLAGKSAEICAEIKEVIADSDLSLLQMETPMSPTIEPINKCGGNLNNDQRCIEMLKDLGHEVMLLANNHIYDVGMQAMQNTMRLFDKHGFKYTGAGATREEADKRLEIKRNGFKIIIFNVAENEFNTVTRHKGGASPLNPPVNISEICELKDRCDILLVVVHGGNEYNPVPSPRMTQTYRAFADAGAGAVINIHPHCPQGIEIWNGVPIVYSPGNLYFPSKMERNNQQDIFWPYGYSPKISFDRNGAFKLQVNAHCYEGNEKIEVLKGRRKKNFNDYLAKISAIITDDAEVEKYFEAWSTMIAPGFLPYLAGTKKYIDNPDATESYENMLVVRGLFVCEAHCELMRTYLRLIEDKRLGEAQKYVQKIHQLKDAGVINT